MFHEPDFTAPAWAESASIYQIFPDRFRNGRSNNEPKTGDVRYDDPVLNLPWGILPEGYCRNYADAATSCPWRFDTTPPEWSPTIEGPRGRDYYGGDLRGVQQYIDYLVSLGVNTIYFNPIFDAGSNHGYDTQDYYKIDPYFGDQKDWENLVKHAGESGVRIVLGDPTGEGLHAGLALAAGPDAQLDAKAEAAVRAVLAAPPWAESGPPTPARLVALLGLLQALDRTVAERLAPRLAARTLPDAARALAREATRKAPLKRSVTEPLQRAFPDLAVHRLDDLAASLGRGKLDPRKLLLGDAAVLVAAFRKDLDLAPLGAPDVDALVQALATVARLRHDLEAGRPLAATDLTRLEHATIAVLGRIGRW